jgi:hypothetical protein
MMIQRPRPLILFAIAVAAALAVSRGAAAALPAIGQVAQNERRICAEPIRQKEREAGIPNQLLAAVALAESGRWDKTDSASFAWPWTVTAEGKGRFFATKEEAITQVERLRARGVRNIDVGCMQINLLHHPDAFADLDEAFDPQANVAYATDFLKQLFEQSRSWMTAVGNYHSATPEFHLRYRQKVMKLWSEARRRDAEAHRQDVIAAYHQRQAASDKAREPHMDLAEADADNAGEPRLPPHGTLAVTHPHLAPLASHAPAPPVSLRVVSQIPSGGVSTGASSAPRSGPGRIVIPRNVPVPLEHRF